MQISSSRELRCSCSSTPLLARWGMAKDGTAFVHIKVYKQKRLYVEMVVTDGNEFRIRCRNCQRWHRVFVRGDLKLQDGSIPRSIPHSLGT